MTTINGASFTPTPLTSTEWAAQESTAGLSGSGMFLDVITPTDIAAALQELNAAIVSQRMLGRHLHSPMPRRRKNVLDMRRSTCSVPRDRGHLP